MIDRKELLQIRTSPLDEWIENIYFAYRTICHLSIRYLYMVMLWRYYEMLSQKYDWNIEVETCSIVLTADMIREDTLQDEFYYLCNANRQLLLSVAERFGWETAIASIDPEEETYEEYKEGRDSLETFLSTYDELTENEKRIFLSYSDIFQGMDYLEGACEIWVLEHPKLGRYLKFRDENMAQVEQLFKEEDKKIMELVKWLGHPLFLQFDENYKREGDRFLAAFICGYGWDGEVELYYLTPEWVISSFVVYELLLHAEQIFGYQEAQEKK